jgi:starvation-inducible DNA-binding protein
MDMIAQGEGAPVAPQIGLQHLAQQLAEILADTVTLHYLAHGFHWNVKGPHFSQFHEFFGDIYEDYAGAEDDIAEAIRRLGYDAPHMLTEFVELTCVSARRVAGDPLEMSAVLYEGNLMGLACLQEGVDLAQQLDQQDVVNLLAARIDMQNKWKWQLGATIGADATQVNTIIIQDSSVTPPADMGKSNAELSLSADNISLSVEAQPYADLVNFTSDDDFFADREGDFVSLGAPEPQIEDEIVLFDEEFVNFSAKNRKLTFSTRTEAVLNQKIELHNASVEFSDKKVTLDQIKAVYRRGVTDFVSEFGSVGDFNASGLERVTDFLHLVKSGAPRLSSYTSDNDLLPNLHPKATLKTENGLTASAYAEQALFVEIKPEDFYKNPEEVIFAMAEFSGLGYETIPAFRATWKRAVSDSENPFERVSKLATDLYDSKDADLLPKLESNI